MKKISIIGAGAAGLSAGIFACSNNTKVIIYERNRILGKKILASGGTRCNILPFNSNIDDFYTDSSKNILKNIFKSWSLEKCKEWIEKDLNIKLSKEEYNNKYFPQSNSSIEVRDKLVERFINNGGIIKNDILIDDIIFENNKWYLKSNNQIIDETDIIIISTGGLSIPKMGTDGIGHNFLKKLGHTINKTYPALTPLKGIHPNKENLAGISLELELKVNNIISKRKGFLFTHKGFSGPSILDMSHYAIKAIEKNSTKPDFLVNWTNLDPKKWEDILINSKGSILNKIKEYLPNRLAEALYKESGINHNSLSELKKEERKRLIQLLTAYKLNYYSHEGYSKAEVTGGGVPLEEINYSSMESKLFKNLFICGEILDVFGRIGGFNFYWAWLTGRLAGISASSK